MTSSAVDGARGEQVQAGGQATDDATEPVVVDAVVVGAGFAGLYMLYRLRELGLTVRVYEAGQDVGGTWYWNRYPGARCDIESIDYAYSFSEEVHREWTWSERYPAQPELLAYINFVADKFDLRRDIAFGTRVTDATFDEGEDRWLLRTDTGERTVATWCVMATGCLSVPRIPSFEGVEDFQGEVLHTGQWPHEGVELAGKRVGVIGTGSSGIQSIPEIARQAEHLHVFQRTPSYSVPAHNRPVDPEKVRHVTENFAAYRQQAHETGFGGDTPVFFQSGLYATDEERAARFEEVWEHGGLPFLGAYFDVAIDERVNEMACEFVRSKIREIVHDPQVAEMLSPREHHIGTKRLCVDTGYYETFNRPNVTLVDVKAAPIERLTATGIQTADAHYELDTVVFATGFDAMTGALLSVDIRGVDGRSLRDVWADGPRAYLGLAVAGFPNLFTITGPGSPSVLTNMVLSIEQHVDWIADCITFIREKGAHRIEATPVAQDGWVDHVNQVADFTLFPRAESWYTGANVPGKPRVFMPYVGGPILYRQALDSVVADGYRGFTIS